MTIPRRRLIRPTLVSVAPPDRHHHIQKLRDRLAKERVALTRWQTKLKRAFNTVEKCQRKVVRLERQINHLEE